MDASPERQQFDYTPYQVAITEVLDSIGLRPPLEEDHIIGLDLCDRFHMDVIFRHMIAHTGISAVAIQRYMDSYLAQYAEAGWTPSESEFKGNLYFTLQKQAIEDAIYQDHMLLFDVQSLFETGKAMQASRTQYSLNWNMPTLYLKTYYTRPNNTKLIQGGEVLSADGKIKYILGFTRDPMNSHIEITQIRNPIFEALQEIERGNFEQGQSLLEQYAPAMLIHLLGKDLPEEKTFLAYICFLFKIDIPNLPAPIEILRYNMKACAKKYRQQEDFISEEKVLQGLEKIEEFLELQSKGYDRGINRIRQHQLSSLFPHHTDNRK